MKPSAIMSFMSVINPNSVANRAISTVALQYHEVELSTIYELYDFYMTSVLIQNEKAIKRKKEAMHEMT